MQLHPDTASPLSDESPRLSSPIEWWFVQGRFGTSAEATCSFMVSLFRHSLEWRGLSAGNACSLMLSVLDEKSGQVRVRDVTYYLLLTYVALFGATRVLEARRWR